MYQLVNHVNFYNQTHLSKDFLRSVFLKKAFYRNADIKPFSLLVKAESSLGNFKKYRM